MIVVAHRGANKEAHENSWSAFEKAIEGGAQRIELDVQWSRDGHGIIMHDDSMLSDTGKNTYISHLTLAEIKKIKLINGEPIPTLVEVVEKLLPRIELNLEIKGKREELAHLVGKLSSASPYKNKILISCFKFETLQYIKKHFPNLEIACLWGEDTINWPFFSMLVPKIYMDTCQAKILHPEIYLTDENLMKQAKEMGWKVIPYATMKCEDGESSEVREKIWNRLYDLGVDGFCTNYPREMVQWLKGRCRK